MLLSTRDQDSQQSFLLCIGISGARLAEIDRLLEGVIPVLGVPDVASARALVSGEAVYVEAANGGGAPASSDGRSGSSTDPHPGLGGSRDSSHAGGDVRGDVHGNSGARDDARSPTGVETAGGRPAAGSETGPETPDDAAAWQAGDWLRTDVPACGLRVDSAQRMVTWHGSPIELSAREFDLVAALARRPGHVWTFADLIETVWRRPYVGDAEAVVSAVKRLRRRIARVTTEIRIDSVRGVGFRLVAPA